MSSTRAVTKRGEQTRARLITATTEVVREVGYARATTRAIADAAGVAEGTIYRHFAHKHELFFAAIFDRNAPIVEWVAGLPERAGTRTVAENLTECLERLASLRDDILPLELSLRADPELAREHQAALAALPDKPPPGPPQDIAAYLAAEQRLGRVRADLDVHQAALTILATLIGLGLIPPGGPAEPTKHIAPALDVLLGGLEPGAD
jgi:AcrR family transcriptional regulator